MLEVICDDSRRANISINWANGRKEIYWYNRLQQVEVVLYEDGTSRTGARTVWEYDSFGNVIREVQPDGYENHYEYDQNQDLVREWDSEGKETLRCYDKEHNLSNMIMTVRTGLRRFPMEMESGPDMNMIGTEIWQYWKRRQMKKSCFLWLVNMMGMGIVWRRRGFNALQGVELSLSIPRINMISEASC